MYCSLSLALAETKAEPRNESKGERTKCAANLSYLSNGYLIVEVLDYSVLPCFSYTAAATKIAPKCGQFFFLLQNGNFLQYFYSVCKGK